MIAVVRPEHLDLVQPHFQFQGAGLQQNADDARAGDTYDVTVRHESSSMVWRTARCTLRATPDSQASHGTVTRSWRSKAGIVARAIVGVFEELDTVQRLDSAAQRPFARRGAFSPSPRGARRLLLGCQA